MPATTVWSTRMCVGSGLGPATFIVPDGYRAVIKCITAYNFGTGSQNIGLAVGGLYVWVGPVPGAGGVMLTQLMVVANSGEQVAMNSAHASMQYSANGFLLWGGLQTPLEEVNLLPSEEPVGGWAPEEYPWVG